MIRQRRGLTIAAGAAPAQYGPLWKFRLIVTCPPGETIGARAVLAGQSRRAYEFGPGDTGWYELEDLHQLQLEKIAGASTATVELWWADEKEDRVYPSPSSGVTSPIASVLYDSGSVAAGAAIDSGVLDLSTLRDLAVIVDNTAGTALRDLSLLSYLDDGATQVDAVVLRRCAFGAAPTGSVYAPGSIRGYVGPNPPGGTSGTHVLFDATSAANAAQDSGALLTEDADQLLAVATSGGTTQLIPSTVDDDGATVPQASLAASNGQVMAWGHGAAVATGNAGFGLAVPVPVPRRAKFTTSAAGVGNVARLRVIARGRVPGTFAQQMILPTKAKLTLAAGGAGAARLTVIGR